MGLAYGLKVGKKEIVPVETCTRYTSEMVEKRGVEGLFFMYIQSIGPLNRFCLPELDLAKLNRGLGVRHSPSNKYGGDMK